MVLPAALLLAGLEMALRLGGYGYPTPFLLREVERGQPVLRDNPRFAWRFMPPGLARSPLPIQIAAEKPANRCRILVVGESAASSQFREVLRLDPRNEAARRFLAEPASAPSPGGAHPSSEPP